MKLKLPLAYMNLLICIILMKSFLKLILKRGKPSLQHLLFRLFFKRKRLRVLIEGILVKNYDKFLY